MKIVFIGYQYPYGNKSFGKSLDVEIFVDSLSEANKRNVDSFARTTCYRDNTIGPG